MRVSLSAGIFVFILLSVFVVPVSAQSTKMDPKETPINGKGSGAFTEGKTIVEKIVFSGLDKDEREFGIYLEDPLYESGLLWHLRQSKVSYSPGETFSAVKVSSVLYSLKAWLSEQGFLKAEVTAFGTPLPMNRMRLRFDVVRGSPLLVSGIVFVGGKNISNDEFLADLHACSGDLFRTFKRSVFEHLTQMCSRQLLFSRGFFKGRIERIAPRVTASALRVIIHVSEGRRYRWGDIKIEGNRALPTDKIKEMSGLNTSEIANAPYLQNFVYERLKREYGEHGYVEYNAEFEPEFIEPKDESSDGIVNVSLTISEGRKYLIRKVEFVGVNGPEKLEMIEGFPLKTDSVFTLSKFESGVEAINKSERFGFLDKDQDVEIRVDEETGYIELLIKVKKRLL